MSCWKMSADERPTFEEVYKELETMNSEYVDFDSPAGKAQDPESVVSEIMSFPQVLSSSSSSFHIQPHRRTRMPTLAKKRRTPTPSAPQTSGALTMIARNLATRSMPRT
jgi:hypothetical protein